jgi:hypothetical protein
MVREKRERERTNEEQHTQLLERRKNYKNDFGGRGKKQADGWTKQEREREKKKLFSSPTQYFLMIKCFFFAYIEGERCMHK